MRLGNLDFEEIEPGTEQTPLVLEAPERLDVLRFVQANAGAVAELWEAKPVFVIKNIWQPALVGTPVYPDVSPHFHVDFGSLAAGNNYIGLILSNPHDANNRGPTEYLQGAGAITILRKYSEALRKIFAGKEPILDSMMQASLNGLEKDEDVRAQVYEASYILHTLRLGRYCGKEALAQEIVEEINKLPIVSLDWSLYPHSAGFVSQLGLHRSGKTVNQRDAQYLNRFYISNRNGVVQASYRLPPGTEELHSAPLSL